MEKKEAHKKTKKYALQVNFVVKSMFLAEYSWERGKNALKFCKLEI